MIEPMACSLIPKCRYFPPVDDSLIWEPILCIDNEFLRATPLLSARSADPPTSSTSLLASSFKTVPPLFLLATLFPGSKTDKDSVKFETNSPLLSL